MTAVDVQMSARVREAVDPAAGRAAVPGVKNIIAVGAGKGGVGKTTVAVNLALALSQCGSKVGIIDGDIYGPNVPMMLGLKTELTTDGQKIVPAEKYGMQVISMAFLTGDDAPIIWRGPMLHGALQQFFREVRWTNLDYLIIDLPPGTGDVVLSLSQTVSVAGAIVVTTPQQVSLADSRRALAMYKKLNIPTLGIVENMSHFVCPSCSHEADIFGHGGGERMAVELGVPFLGRVPLYQPIREGSDKGVPLLIGDPDSPAARAIVRSRGTGGGAGVDCELLEAHDSVDGGAMKKRSLMALLALFSPPAACRLRAHRTRPEGGSPMPSSIVEPYLKIQTELYNDSVENVRANAGNIATASDSAGIARHEDRHGGRAARVGDRAARRAREVREAERGDRHLHGRSESDAARRRAGGVLRDDAKAVAAGRVHHRESL